MRLFYRIAAPAALALAVGGCSLGGLLGGGGKPPPTLLTLAAEAPAPGEFTWISDSVPSLPSTGSAARNGAPHGRPATMARKRVMKAGEK